MSVKTLGSELNSIHDTILIKKSKFDSIVLSLQEYETNKTTELDNLLNEIKETSRNLNNVLYLLEEELEKLLNETDYYIDNTLYYEEVLPVIKDKFINIFNNYLTLFETYELQIEEIVGENIDNIINQIELSNKSYKFNIYNVNNTNNDSKNYLQAISHGNTWVSGKFSDEYLAKSITGSITTFHSKLKYDEKIIDYCDNQSNSIYEVVLYHPDYGMIYYKTTGSKESRPIIDQKTKLPFYNIDVYSDGFLGELSELKSQYEILYGINYIEESNSNSSNRRKIPFLSTFSNIATDTPDIKKFNSKGQLDTKFFIYKINVHEAPESVYPSLFFVGQNKDTDDSITKEFTKTDNSTTTSFINLHRSSLKQQTNNLYTTLEPHALLSNDTDENINENFKLNPQQDAAGFIENNSSYFMINIRRNDISRLGSVMVNVSGSGTTIFNYYYDDEYHKKAAKNTIIGTLKNTNIKRKNNNSFFNNLFDYWTSKVYQTIGMGHRFYPNYLKYKLNNLNNKIYYRSNVSKIQSNQPFGVYQDLFSDNYVLGLSQVNLETNPEEFKNTSSNQTKLRNDSRLDYLPFLLRYLGSQFTLKKYSIDNLPNQSDSYHDHNNDLLLGYEEYFDFYQDPNNLDIFWWMANDVRYYQQNPKILEYMWYLDLPGSLQTSNNFYSIINSTLNKNNVSDQISEQDLIWVKEQLNKYIDESFYQNTEYSSGDIGKLMIISYNIENPDIIFNGLYAKAGSVLKIDEYPEAFKIFQHKFDNDIDSDKSCNSLTEFALPNLSDKYILGADDNTILTKEDSILPKIDLKIKFDSESNSENSNFTGLISNTKPVGDNIPITGVITGSYGNGFNLSDKILIKHNSESLKNKGNDVRVDIYIKVRNYILYK